MRLLGQKKERGKKTGGASLLLPKVRRNPLIEIISINTGCLNQCSYCKTKHARGELGSYPIGGKEFYSLSKTVVADRVIYFKETYCLSFGGEFLLLHEKIGALPDIVLFVSVSF